MSYITIQVGQCGNQLGPYFFDSIASEYTAKTGQYYDGLGLNPFFRMAETAKSDPRPIARSILIDTEPSVVQSALVASKRKRSRWVYTQSNCIIQQSGAGNNWAIGYLQYGPAFHSLVAEIVRKEAEKLDVFGGFLLMQSVAGGTGSGLGAFLTESLHDTFPSACFINFTVWPYSIGEVTVQSYNSVHSLSRLMEGSHAIFLADNDALSEQCQKILRIPSASYVDMNRCAMKQLAGFLLPSQIRPISGQDIKERHHPGNWTRLVADGLSVLCPTRYQKLLRCHTIPQIPSTATQYVSYNWNALLKRTTETVLNPGRGHGRCFANFLTLRGRNSIQPDVTLLTKDDLYFYQVARLGVAYNPVPMRGNEATISLVTNSTKNIQPVVKAYHQARKLFKSRAFLHSYEDHGLERKEFENAFDFLADHVISSYSV